MHQSDRSDYGHRLHRILQGILCSGFMDFDPGLRLLDLNIYFCEYSWFENCAWFGNMMVPSLGAYIEREYRRGAKNKQT